MRIKCRIICMLLVLLPVLLAAGCGKKAEAELFCMDTVVRLTVHGRNAEAALAACTDELYAMERLFSVTEAGSDAARINQADGAPVWVSPDTQALLQTAQTVSAETDGAFDVTVYPLVTAWGFLGGAQRVPAQETIRDLLPLVGMERLTLTDGTVTAEAGTRVDLGGIAKGYASARLAEVAKGYGVSSALFTLGGNVQALGSRPDGSAWRVGVMDPADPSAVVGVLAVRDRAVITAGGYQRYFVEDGVTYHHILDPHTGYPADSDLLSVTVVAEDGAAADALSTALFVLGEEAAIARYRALGSFEMVLVKRDHSVLYTAGLDFSAAAGVGAERIAP